MERVSQSITGTGVVYFPPTHHLLHLALAMIPSVLLSRTLPHNSVSPHASFHQAALCACVCASAAVCAGAPPSRSFCLFILIWVSVGVWIRAARQMCVLLSCARKHDDVLHPFIARLRQELTPDAEIMAL